MSLDAVLLLMAAGAVAGLLGGLFGIGGGVVVVPALYAVFGAMGVPDAERIKLAVGTSLATIIVTSARSLAGHARSGRVDWDVLRLWGPFIAAGALAGAALARVMAADALTLVFALGALSVAIQRLVWGRGEPTPGAAMPAAWVQALLGAGTGLVSALMGIGGGVVGVLLLTTFGRTLHASIATAAGFGLVIAVPGALGFALAGRGAAPGSLGYVHLAGFASVAALSALTAPLGARLAHRLPAALLSRAFAGYLAVTGTLLLREALSA